MLDSEVYSIRTSKAELRNCAEASESRQERRWLSEVGKMHGTRGLTANSYEEPELPRSSCWTNCGTHRVSFFPR